MSVRTVTPSSDLPPPAVKGRLNQLTDLEAELAALADMSLTELRKRWQSVTDKPVPRVRRTLLHLALAFELQAALHGGLSRRAELRLAYLAGKGTADQAAVPGMRLVRWNGQTWRSLSEVARAITGTRWSGPAFFGLRHKGRAA